MKIRRIIAILAAAAMLTGCASNQEDDGFRVPDDPDKVEDELIGRDKDLIPSEKCSLDTIYNELCAGLSRSERVIKFDGEVNFEDVDKAVNRVVYTKPEFFWISGYDASTSRHDTEISIWVMDDLNDAELQMMRNDLEMAANSIISQIPPTADDFGKVVFVHDYIVEHTDYDKTAVHKGMTGFFGTAYGCLVEGSAICQGYTLGFMYIMNKLGIPCGLAKGMAGTESHAWNYVTINGCTYWVDTTWDDPSYGETELNTVSHAYCLINDDLLYRTRTIDRDDLFVPTCPSIVDNYFNRRGAYFYSYDADAIMRAVEADSSERRAELMFSDGALLDTAVQSLIKDGDFWTHSSLLNYNESVHYSVDNEMCVLSIIY